MLGLWDHHAMAWYQAEKADGQVAWHDLSMTRKDAIRSHVQRVLAGDVPRCMCSIGDLVVLEGRQREGHEGYEWKTDGSPADFPDPFMEQKVRTTRGMSEQEKTYMPRLHGVRERRWAHFYDSLTFGDADALQSTSRLFGNRNVGVTALTNLQVACQLASDQTFLFVSQYLTVAGFDVAQEALVRRTLEGCVVTMVMGDRPQIQYSAWDLFAEPRPMRIIMPIRQCFNVEMNFSQSITHASVELDMQCKKVDRERIRPRFVMHFEGWQTRDVG